MSFTESLKEVRKERNLKQKDIAEKLGVSAQSYNQYEQGKRKPKHETILKLCEVLNCAYMYEKNGEPRLYTFHDTTIRKSPCNSAADSDTMKDRLLSNYESVNADGKQRIADYSDDIASNDKYKQ